MKLFKPTKLSWPWKKKETTDDEPEQAPPLQLTEMSPAETRQFLLETITESLRRLEARKVRLRSGRWIMRIAWPVIGLMLFFETYRTFWLNGSSSLLGEYLVIGLYFYFMSKEVVSAQLLIEAQIAEATNTLMLMDFVERTVKRTAHVQDRVQDLLGITIDGEPLA